MSYVDYLFVLGRLRQDEGLGRRTEMDERIRLVRLEVGRLGEQPVRPDDASQFLQKRVIHRGGMNIMCRNSARINYRS